MAKSLSSENLMRRINVCIMLLAVLAAFPALAQTNRASAATNSAMAEAKAEAAFRAAVLHTEEVRAKCIQGRRLICGKILLVQPEGLVVESGYTNLLREPLTKSWLVPGTAVASRAEDQVEGNEPGATCIGTVFLTDLPRSRGAKPKRYDYVILTGYPTGQHTYTSLGTITKTVRSFSAQLPRAVAENLQSSTNLPPAEAKVK
jgi:hypothetical protein